MKFRFYNARILSLEEGSTEITEHMQLWVENGLITFLGPDMIANVTEQKWDRQIDCEGNLLLPGFKNAHTHSAMTFLRSQADDLPLQDWLQKNVFPMEKKLLPEDIYALTKLAIMEYVSGGITAICDMYLTPDTIAQACIDAGIRCVQVSGINDFSQSVDELEAYYLKWNQKNSLISFCLGFHAQYTCSETLLKQIVNLSEKYKAPVYMHLSETTKEVEDCVKEHGTTPPVYLERLGMFRYGGGCFHCVHMTEEDIEVMKRNHLFAVTNPASNLKLASGIAPIQTLLSNNIDVAIGTDGPASNNSLDFFKEMYLVTALAKVREKDASVVAAEEVIKMACRNGALAIGLTQCDCLKVGKYADLVLLNLKSPNMQPINNIVKNIVYSGGKQNVLLTMINGKILYENGQYFLDEEPEQIYQKAQDITERIKKEVL